MQLDNDQLHCITGGMALQAFGQQTERPTQIAAALIRGARSEKKVLEG